MKSRAHPAESTLWLLSLLGVGIGVMGGSPDNLEGVMAGLVPAIHVVRRIECFASAARAKALCLQKLCCGAPDIGPVFEALPAWVAGTSPAMTTRAETNSNAMGVDFILGKGRIRAIPIPFARPNRFGAPRRQQKGEEKAAVTFEARCDTGRNFVI
jgi:hypothetical protein